MEKKTVKALVLLLLPFVGAAIFTKMTEDDPPYIAVATTGEFRIEFLQPGNGTLAIAEEATDGSVVEIEINHGFVAFQNKMTPLGRDGEISQQPLETDLRQVLAQKQEKVVYVHASPRLPIFFLKSATDIARTAGARTVRVRFLPEMM